MDHANSTVICTLIAACTPFLARYWAELIGLELRLRRLERLLLHP